ncbi:hypothetical protein HED60_02040 [Planctomycetales bacterium ZRK34]|nr:hypothetical protein HED60_02040 [Planctomycetales bacterium ZRK34]
MKPLHLLGLIVIVFAAGCSQAVPDVSNPIPIATGEYDRVFDAAILVLRDEHFVVARKDRRFGVVTTEPRVAASAFEPWNTDNTTTAQTTESTLNLDRRTVRVMINPVANAGGEYELAVEVTLDRRQHPTRLLNTAAMGAVGVGHRETNVYRPLLTESGLEESYWTPVGRDELLAKRLLAKILRRSVHLDQPVEVAQTDSPADDAQ